jgi:hypothetical protein
MTFMAAAPPGCRQASERRRRGFAESRTLPGSRRPRAALSVVRQLLGAR